MVSQVQQLCRCFKHSASGIQHRHRQLLLIMEAPFATSTSPTALSMGLTIPSPAVAATTTPTSRSVTVAATASAAAVPTTADSPPRAFCSARLARETQSRLGVCIRATIAAVRLVKRESPLGRRPGVHPLVGPGLGSLPICTHT